MKWKEKAPPFFKERPSGPKTAEEAFAPVKETPCKPYVAKPWEKRLCLLTVLILFPAALALHIAAKLSTPFANWYAARVYPVLAGPVGTVTGAVPFSLTETCIVLLAAFLVFWIVRAICRRKQNRGMARRNILRLLKRLAAAASVLYFLFVCNFGMNYCRSSFAETAGLPVRASTVGELKALCAGLITRANALSLMQERDENGLTVYDGGDFQMARRTRDAYADVAELYPQLTLGGETFGTPKPVLGSVFLAYGQIAGVSCPFLVEANISTAGPALLRASTMMHEQTHLAGYMREDEANFIAYLACLRSGDAYMEYSGTALALIHAMNALHAADPESWYLLRSAYSDGLDADIGAQNDFVHAHDGPAAEFSDAVNDAYLKANGQQSGSKSYGEMVDLLLAYARSGDAAS
ncbi:MAG TPA: DUF3810 domain-containing protein [Oscillospiraceae bacterium]|nr:DUF3810 domain-containing protein [Oscillospiraceae bacterium]HRW56935.1 DUF3810 domain-containing protein [Oscillospiraceae bacterium]